MRRFIRPIGFSSVAIGTATILYTNPSSNNRLNGLKNYSQCKWSQFKGTPITGYAKIGNLLFTLEISPTDQTTTVYHYKPNTLYATHTSENPIPILSVTNLSTNTSFNYKTTLPPSTVFFLKKELAEWYTPIPHIHTIEITSNPTPTVHLYTNNGSLAHILDITNTSSILNREPTYISHLSPAEIKSLLSKNGYLLRYLDATKQTEEYIVIATTRYPDAIKYAKIPFANKIRASHTINTGNQPMWRKILGAFTHDGLIGHIIRHQR